MASKSKKIFGVGALIAGAALIVFSFVIKAKVREGEGQISSAEQSVEKGKGLFGGSPYTKAAGSHIMAGAERKISEGKEDIIFYSSVANVMLIVGIVLIGVGGYSMFVKKSAR